MGKAKSKFDGWAFKHLPAWQKRFGSKWGNVMPAYEGKPVRIVFDSGRWVRVRFVEVKPNPARRKA